MIGCARRVCGLVLPLATLLVVAGCGGAGSAGGPSGTTSAPAGSTTTRAASPSAGTTSPLPGPSTSPTSPTAGPTRPKPVPAPSPSRTSSAPAASPTGLPAALLGGDWELLPAGGAKVLALTFDAGASNAGVASILATLQRTGTPATFFLTGSFATRYPADARRIAGRYRVGNHTATHRSLTGLDDATVRAEIILGAEQIRRVTGVDPRPWFRFPNGDRNARTIADANRLGYAAIRWTVDSLGWEGTRSGGQTVTTVTARVLAAARPGGIVLMHVGANPEDGTTLDADALPAVISGLHRLGYRLVTLDDLRP